MELSWTVLDIWQILLNTLANLLEADAC